MKTEHINALFNVLIASLVPSYGVIADGVSNLQKQFEEITFSKLPALTEREMETAKRVRSTEIAGRFTTGQVEAIMMYRHRTNCSLLEAKKVVESFANSFDVLPS